MNRRVLLWLVTITILASAGCPPRHPPHTPQPLGVLGIPEFRLRPLGAQEFLGEMPLRADRRQGRAGDVQDRLFFGENFGPSVTRAGDAGASTVAGA
jgi:hypothetical protein